MLAAAWLGLLYNAGTLAAVALVGGSMSLLDFCLYLVMNVLLCQDESCCCSCSYRSDVIMGSLFGTGAESFAAGTGDRAVCAVCAIFGADLAVCGGSTRRDRPGAPGPSEVARGTGEGLPSTKRQCRGSKWQAPPFQVGLTSFRPQVV